MEVHSSEENLSVNLLTRTSFVPVNAALQGVMYVHFRPEPKRLAMPDVCCDLVWVRHKLYFTGPTSRGQPIAWPDEEIVLLNIDPLVARAWLGVPMSHLVDRRVELRDIDSARAGPLEELFHAGGAGTLATGTPRMQPPSRAAVAAEAIRARSPVDHAAATVGLSERQLERVFDDQFGLSPRLYRRILRLRGALQAAATGGNLAAVAATAGYADQAHFTRDVRAFMALSPRAVLGHVGKIQDAHVYTREY